VRQSKNNKSGMLAGGRVGFDTIWLSTGKDTRTRRCFAAIDFPPDLPGYRQRYNYRPPWSGYDRCVEYQHVSNPDAPIVEVFCEPRKPFLPVCRVRLRATIRRLLDLDAAESIVEALATRFRVPFTVAEVELAADFDGGSILAERLDREHYIPRVRSAVKSTARGQRDEQRDDNADATLVYYRGRRRSGRSSRVYDKHEDGYQLVRVEWVFRRARLKVLGVVSIADLRKIEWAKVVGSRFVRFDEAVFNGDPFDCPFYRDLFEVLGPNRALQRHIPRKDRHRVRQCLRQTENHRVIERLLRAFERRLRRQAL